MYYFMLLFVCCAYAQTSGGGMAMPPPPFPGVCVDDADTKSYLNGTCTTEQDCADAYMYVCKSGRCRCAESFIPQKIESPEAGQPTWVCVNAPYEYQPCTDVCQKPFQCAKPQQQTVIGGPDLPMAQPDPNVKLCQCLPPYSQTNGVCSKECKSDEIWYQNDCRRRCGANEIAMDNGECKKIVNLGEPCDVQRQCGVAFSVCQGGKCVCTTGFSPTSKKDACESKKRTCPMGDPITKNNNVVECKIVNKKSKSPKPTPKKLPSNAANSNAGGKPMPASAPVSMGNGGGGGRPGQFGVAAMPPIWYYSNDQLKDTCDDGQFCMLTSGATYMEEGASGHCCPKPKAACPIGDPHPNATCGPIFYPMEGVAGSPDAPYCPYDTHACQHVQLGTYDVSLCCPIACSQNQVLVKQRCYPQRNYGDQCDYDEQCRGHTGSCIKGACGCGSGRKAQGDQYYKYCQKVCKDDEVLIGDDCAPILKVGDPCDPQSYSQCPTNAYCSQKKKCVCICGYVKLSDRMCGREPVCGSISPPFPMPVDSMGGGGAGGFSGGAVESSPAVASSGVAQAGGGAASNAGVAQPPKASPPVPRGKRASSKTANAVFCQDPSYDKKPPVSSAVKTCPKNQYCAQYEYGLGLCCPMPEKPMCPDGSAATAKCDPKAPDSCGQGKYCYRYIFPAGNDQSSLGYACCGSGFVGGPIG